MPEQLTRTTRTIDGYHVTVEFDPQMALPLGYLSLIAPAVRVSIYRAEANDGAATSAGIAPHVLLLRHIFPAPEAKMRKAARQQWIDGCVRRLLDLLAMPEAQLGDQRDVLMSGVYSAGSDLDLYVIETARPREGYTEALAFHAPSGSSVHRRVVSADSLAPVRELISQVWQRELQTYRPRDGSRYTLDHVAGCLLGGAVGDALGAGLARYSLAQIRAEFGEDGANDYIPINGQIGTLSWHSQMSLFTAEGFIRANRRYREKGICDVVGVIQRAYYRWLSTQGEPPPDPDAIHGMAHGWLASLPALHHRRGASHTVFAALRGGARGTPAQPINQSKGAGALARVAPAGLSSLIDPFGMGVDIAALTHGHPTGYLAAGCFVVLIKQIIDGAALTDALDAASTALSQVQNHEECLTALNRARQLATHAPATAESVEQLGRGFSAEEALAIAVFCALKAEDFAHGVRLAINHSGASDLTGALTGQLLGALLGKRAIPERWLQRLELRDEIERLGRDLFLEFGGFPHASWFASGWDTYPGW